MNLRFFLLGYAVGVAVFLLVRLIQRVVLSSECAGHTTFALIAPLILGPGGLAFATTNWNKPGWGYFGLGLAAASLFPALFFGAQSLAYLKELGCAPAMPKPGAP